MLGITLGIVFVDTQCVPMLHRCVLQCISFAACQVPLCHSTDIKSLNSTLLHVQGACEATINKYGVGSCGPRGFYGTIDVHLDLEKRIADFMQTQESIIYAYDLATVPSILPAFANAKDLIICDEVCGMQEGTAGLSLHARNHSCSCRQGCHYHNFHAWHLKHSDTAFRLEMPM